MERPPLMLPSLRLNMPPQLLRWKCRMRPSQQGPNLLPLLRLRYKLAKLPRNTLQYKLLLRRVRRLCVRHYHLARR